MQRMILAGLMLLSLAACGQKAALRPPTDGELPPPPYGREERVSSDAMLEPPPVAYPERSVELRKRSEEREDDPFDLPPAE